LNRVLWARLMNEMENENSNKPGNEQVPNMEDDSGEYKAESDENLSKRRFLYSKRRFLYSKRGMSQEE
jgi:hypothetical protein